MPPAGVFYFASGLNRGEGVDYPVAARATNCWLQTFGQGGRERLGSADVRPLPACRIAETDTSDRGRHCPVSRFTRSVASPSETLGELRISAQEPRKSVNGGLKSGWLALNTDLTVEPA